MFIFDVYAIHSTAIYRQYRKNLLDHYVRSKQYPLKRRPRISCSVALQKFKGCSSLGYIVRHSQFIIRQEQLLLHVEVVPLRC